MANNFTVNPMRVDGTMANDYLTTIAASAGLERPVKIVKIAVETTGAPGAAGAITFTDGSAGANVLWEKQVTTTANVNVANDEPNGSLLWRNFKCTAIQTNCVVWIYRK